MGCVAVKGLLRELAAGTLDDSQRDCLRAHAETCPECAAKLAALGTLHDRLHQLGRCLEARKAPFVFDPSSPGVAETRYGHTGGRLFKLGAGLVAAAALIGMAVMIRPSERPVRDATVVEHDATGPAREAGHLSRPHTPRMQLASYSDRRLAAPALCGTPRLVPYRAKVRAGRAALRDRVPSLILPRRRLSHDAKPEDSRMRSGGVPVGRRGDPGNGGRA